MMLAKVPCLFILTVVFVSLRSVRSLSTMPSSSNDAISPQSSSSMTPSTSTMSDTGTTTTTTTTTPATTPGTTTTTTATTTETTPATTPGTTTTTATTTTATTTTATTTTATTTTETTPGTTTTITTTAPTPTEFKSPNSTTASTTDATATGGASPSVTQTHSDTTNVPATTTHETVVTSEATETTNTNSPITETTYDSSSATGSSPATQPTQQQPQDTTTTTTATTTTTIPITLASTTPSTTTATYPVVTPMPVYTYFLFIGKADEFSVSCTRDCGNSTVLTELLTRNFRDLPGFVIVKMVSGKNSTGSSRKKRSTPDFVFAFIFDTASLLAQKNRTDLIWSSFLRLNETASAVFFVKDKLKEDIIKHFNALESSVCPSGYTYKDSMCRHLCSDYESCGKNGECKVHVAANGIASAYCLCMDNYEHEYSGPNCEESSTSKTKIIAIVAAVLGTFCGLFLIVIIIMCVRQRKNSGFKNSKYQLGGASNPGYSEIDMQKIQ